MKFLILFLLVTISSCERQLTPEEEQHYQKNIDKVQKAVSNWIKEHALYPESYKSISFDDYSEAITKIHDQEIYGTENYVIRHVHQILDKDSVLTNFSGYFILEHDYFVNVIETEKSNSIGGAFPPEVKLWTDKFGRLETLQDSLELQNKRKQHMKKIAKDIKESLLRGDVYTDNPEDLEILKSVIDTLGTK